MIFVLLKAYLNLYPNARYVPLAEVNLDNFERQLLGKLTFRFHRSRAAKCPKEIVQSNSTLLIEVMVEVVLPQVDLHLDQFLDSDPIQFQIPRFGLL